MSTITQHVAGMFCWPELATSDQAAAKRFYSGLFGWTAEDSPIGNGETYTMLRHNGREVGALYTQQPQQRQQNIPPSWLAYIAVDNADQAAAKVKQAGGKVLTEPFDVMEHGRMAVCQDPTGGTFAVWQAKKHTGAGILNETGAMIWNELITFDSAKAASFYKQVFGWTEEPMKTTTALGGTYTVFKNRDASAGGMIKATPEMTLTHPYWLTYFAVDDTDKAVSKAQQLGGKTMMPPTDIPDVGKIAVLTDPQGAWFAIIHPRPLQ